MTRKLLTMLLLAMVLVVPSLADEPLDGRAGRAEVRFLEGMIDHHQMALDMAADCLEKASTEDVKTICQNVISAQSAEIELMQGWLADWYGIAYTPMPMMDMPMAQSGSGGHGGHGGHGGSGGGLVTDPPMMMGMMAGFNRLEGIDYDIAWLEAMIDHHDDALHMAERILRRGQHPELIQLANRIIADQSAEIQQMETLLANLE